MPTNACYKNFLQSNSREKRKKKTDIVKLKKMFAIAELDVDCA